MTWQNDSRLIEQRNRIAELFEEGWVPLNDSSNNYATPFIRNVINTNIMIYMRGNQEQVSIFFDHDLHPGKRFAYMFPLPSNPKSQHAAIDLKEEIETGLLSKIVQNTSRMNDNQVIWIN